MTQQPDWTALEGTVPRPEYPRPALVRPEWQCLNGVWEFSIDPNRVGLMRGWQDGQKFSGKIVVPFAYQWPMSGRGDHAVEEVVWYARSFQVPCDWLGEDRDVLLHFGAVDYRCTVWVNGHEVGRNTGGHVPFWIDIAPFLCEGENRLCVRVEDSQDPAQPRGKQAVNGLSRTVDYWNTTGIWQSVWLEPVPSMRIDSVRVIPKLGDDPADDAVEIRAYLHAPAIGWRIRVEALNGDTVVSSAEGSSDPSGVRTFLPMPNAARWSPESPTLHSLRVSLIRDGKVADEVTTYAGLRSVGIKDGHLTLNGEQLYLRMVLDQGYWPESGMTPPSEDAIRADIEMTKRMGFNAVRKHQKVEDPRWLYWCDRLGLVVWAEMANARAWSPEAEERFLGEWERAVRRDLSHPCIVAWVPLNESWGVPGLSYDHPGQVAFVERTVALTRRLDPTRPVVDNDGWEHTDVTDILAIHDYTQPGSKLAARYEETKNGGPLPNIWGDGGLRVFASGARWRGQPVVFSEVGGFLTLPKDLPQEEWDHLYRYYGTSQGPEELLAKYRDLMQALASLPFVSGFCYTQLTDVEQEINGLVAYDRTPKVDPEELARIHAEVFGI